MDPRSPTRTSRQSSAEWPSFCRHGRCPQTASSAGGQELKGVVSAKGYRSAEIAIPCVSQNRRLEQIVLLERSDH
jgi:hypothetical protein